MRGLKVAQTLGTGPEGISGFRYPENSSQSASEPTPRLRKDRSDSQDIASYPILTPPTGGLAEQNGLNLQEASSSEVLLNLLDQLSFIDPHTGQAGPKPVQVDELREQILAAKSTETFEQQKKDILSDLKVLRRYADFLQNKYQLRQRLISHLPAYVQQHIQQTGDYGLIRLYYSSQDPKIPMDWPLHSRKGENGQTLSAGLNDTELLKQFFLLKEKSPQGAQKIRRALKILQSPDELAQRALPTNIQAKSTWDPSQFFAGPQANHQGIALQVRLGPLPVQHSSELIRPHEVPSLTMEDLETRLDRAETLLKKAPWEEWFAAVEETWRSHPAFILQTQLQEGQQNLMGLIRVLEQIQKDPGSPLGERHASKLPMLFQVLAHAWNKLGNNLQKFQSKPDPWSSELPSIHQSMGPLIHGLRQGLEDPTKTTGQRLNLLKDLATRLAQLQAAALRPLLVDQALQTVGLGEDPLAQLSQSLAEISQLFGGTPFSPRAVERSLREQGGIGDLKKITAALFRKRAPTLMDWLGTKEPDLSSLQAFQQNFHALRTTQEARNFRQTILMARSQVQAMKEEVGGRRFLRERRDTGVYDYVLNQYDQALNALDSGDHQGARALFLKAHNGSHQGALLKFEDFQWQQKAQAFTAGAAIIVASGFVGGMVGGALFGGQATFGSGSWFAQVAASSGAFWATHHLGRAMFLGELPPWQRFFDPQSSDYRPASLPGEISKDMAMTYGMMLFLGAGAGLYQASAAGLKNFSQSAYLGGLFTSEYASFTAWDAIALNVDHLYHEGRLPGAKAWQDFLSLESLADRAWFLAALKSGQGMAKSILAQPGLSARQQELLGECRQWLQDFQRLWAQQDPQRLQEYFQGLSKEIATKGRDFERALGEVLFPQLSQSFLTMAQASGGPEVPGFFAVDSSHRGGGKTRTFPQTSARPAPKFQRCDPNQSNGAKSPGTLNLEKAQKLLTGNSGLKGEDALSYTQFVTDRVGFEPALLKPFRLGPQITDLEAGLHDFTQSFSDESPNGMPQILREAGLLSEGQGSHDTLHYNLLVLMRRAKSDAVDFLDRLGKKPSSRVHWGFLPFWEAKDPNRLQPQSTYRLKDWQELQPDFPELTPEVLRESYEHMVAQRILTQQIYQHYQKEEFAFAVTDAGHEIVGTAAAQALFHEVNPEAFAISPHYRSGTLVGMWARLKGYPDFFADYIRQQLSRITDPWSKGRQTASHFNDMRYQVLPGQSEVGRNLQKAAGYARALQQEGHQDGLVYAELGDGSMALSDFYEAMNIGTVMGHQSRSLPLMIGIMDNQAAISVEPSSGRALADMQSWAKSFSANFFICDGNDWLDVYQTYRVAAAKTRAEQRPTIIWVQNLSRMNNHSSAAQFGFDANQKDALLDYSHSMLEEGLLQPGQELRKNAQNGASGFFNNYQLGSIGLAQKTHLEGLWRQVAAEPEPTFEQTLEDVRIEFVDHPEPKPETRPTNIIINGAIRAAMRDTLQEHPLVWINGQDTGMKGGVFQATAGLWELFPDRVQDAPINEPAIISSAVGFALRPGAIAIPEIQFGDYSTSAYHWMVYAGNLLWTSGGTQKINFNLRLPVEPGIYGAVYHSTPLEGLMAAIPGLTILAPSTTYDSYGLLRSSFEYPGPTMIFEPKALYRRAVGPAFPNEPLGESPEQQAARKAIASHISIHRGIPDIPKDIRVPLGKAAVRREGKDLTLVTWGLAHYQSLQVIDQLVAKGIDVELIDLRTIVPPDMPTVLESVNKTKHLLVVHQDRVFAGLGREIQGQVHEALDSPQLKTKVLGMAPVPGMPQNRAMEDAVMVTGDKIVTAALKLMRQ